MRYLYLVILFVFLVLYIYLLFSFFIFLFKIKNGSPLLFFFYFIPRVSGPTYVSPTNPLGPLSCRPDKYFHYLDVENLNFDINECEEFNPFEYEENPTPTSNPQFVPSSNSEHVGKKPRVSKRIFLVWNHFTIINKENSKGQVENVAQRKYCKKYLYSCKISNGTGHLRRHAEQCTKKLGALHPKQSQISQN